MILYMISSRGEGTDVMMSNGEVRHFGENAVDLLNRMCIRNGSTLSGRIDAVRSIHGYTQKIPVLVSERSQELFFPLSGIEAEKNIWISYSEFLDSRGISRRHTRITFMGAQKLEVDYDPRVIRGQTERCRTILQFLNQIDENPEVI